ncbi:hypothetical protein E4631_01880 [Hymenobacter sp. UV11]|uniref:hypothetical protein n=1 Tax=Hymenobacter sp. UV11 TaxID=1849735 RepID=UPI00105D4066|nr:hypothetical protein [Hymenobacter sp. UV11]TFZ68835.1 hypothetical protein E4631_01880 [Hymenobacter sp. UV11]
MDKPEISVKLLAEEILMEEDVLCFSFLVAANRIACMTNFALHEQQRELRLTRLHLEGVAINQVGRPALWEVAYQLGRYFGVKTLRIEGGRRTTGRYSGKLPTPFVITIPDA